MRFLLLGRHFDIGIQCQNVCTLTLMLIIGLHDEACAEAGVERDTGGEGRGGQNRAQNLWVGASSLLFCSKCTHHLVMAILLRPTAGPIINHQKSIVLVVVRFDSQPSGKVLQMALSGRPQRSPPSSKIGWVFGFLVCTLSLNTALPSGQSRRPKGPEA